MQGGSRCRAWQVSPLVGWSSSARSGRGGCATVRGDVHVEESDLKASVGFTIRVARDGGADVEDLHNGLITNKYKRFLLQSC